MRNPLASLRSLDWILCGAAIGVMALGLLAISSVDLSYGDGFPLLRRQLLAAGIALAVAFVISRVHPEFFRATSRTWYFFGVALLVLVLIFGETIRGTKGWFQFAGFSFQPVELMKIALLLVLARIIDRRGRQFQTGLFFFGTALVVLIPIVLVMIQPDLGSALVLGGLWLWLVMFVGTRRVFLLMVLTSVVAAAVLGWAVFLKPYQKERLLAFVQPERDPLGSGYNVQQSIIAIGSGGWLGRGFGYGSQNQLNFLPERQTDFIFSVIAEELGFLGVTALFVGYFLIGWRIVRRAQSARDDFTLSVLMGALGLLVIQIVVNVGGTLGVVPVTGITLPLVSYGGSSLIMNGVLLGVVLSITSHQTTSEY